MTSSPYTPREIVELLDKYIIGQEEAKKTMAIALRNRYRRKQLDPEIAEEISPKNIIMIGPTGVGKTEIARRLALLLYSPFLKVEASKYTEVGYMGRDVESIIRDLVEIAVRMVKKELLKQVREKAAKNVEELLLDLLLPELPKKREETEEEETSSNTRKRFRDMLREGKFEKRVVEVETTQKAAPPPGIDIIGAQGGFDEIGGQLSDFFSGMLPEKKKRKKMTVKQARQVLLEEEAQKLIDEEKVKEEAVKLTENSGIVFIDEIDKIAGAEARQGPDVSRSGVQRDLLPMVEGTTVHTKHGLVRTNHILFVAAGAFHKAKPSDLLPELQGRFPLRVTLNSLDKHDFFRILKEPENALIKQYKALLGTEGLNLQFRDSALKQIAYFAGLLNERDENIGARRLHSVMEKLLEEISFSATEYKKKKIVIDDKYVLDKLSRVVKDEDISKFIL